MIMQFQAVVCPKQRRKLCWSLILPLLRIGHFVTLIIGCHGVTKEIESSVCSIDNHQCDPHVRCPAWKLEGECIRSQSYMLQYCPGSCEDSIEVEVENDNLSNDACNDRHTDCKIWAIEGECDTNYDVKMYCAASCRTCEIEPTTDATGEDIDETCTDDNENCYYWFSIGECSTNPEFMNQFCMKSCKACHMNTASRSSENLSPELQKTTSFGTLQVVGGAMANLVLQRVIESIAYMESETILLLDESQRAECQNQNELCTFWAVNGECEENAEYMKINCAPSCMTCHINELSQHCPKLGDNVTAALQSGDLNVMFNRIVDQAPGNRTDLSDEDKQALLASYTPIYTVHVHSQPGIMVDETSADLNEAVHPWIVTLDNFLTEEECDTLIQLGYKYDYERSIEKVEGSYDDIESDYRTSENAWCSRARGCRNETIPKRLHQRMADVLRIPPENSEDMQILKYEVGQYYREHHDYVPLLAELPCGPRILTFFLYLSDVEGGGSTNFPELDITIEPKRGRALIWPSVHNTDPMKQDLRMGHQALEVTAGKKFAANGWFHLYDFETPLRMGCI